MFDHIHVKSGDTRHYTEVTEKRAPTDQSVRLLREMEEEARKSIQLVTEVAANEMTYRWWLTHEPDLDTYRVTCRFSMNGREHDFNFTYCQMDWVRHGKREAAQKVYQKVVEEVAKILTADLFEKSSRTLFERVR